VSETYLDSLARERAWAAAQGLTDRVADIDAEIVNAGGAPKIERAVDTKTVQKRGSGKA
jgi:hypothetical protein